MLMLAFMVALVFALAPRYENQVEQSFLDKTNLHQLDSAHVEVRDVKFMNGRAIVNNEYLFQLCSICIDEEHCLGKCLDEVIESGGLLEKLGDTVLYQTDIYAITKDTFIVQGIGI